MELDGSLKVGSIGLNHFWKGNLILKFLYLASIA